MTAALSSRSTAIRLRASRRSRLERRDRSGRHHALRPGLRDRERCRAASTRRQPAYLPKAYFLMLMRNERIAEFRTRFDEQSGIFSIFKRRRLAGRRLASDGCRPSRAGRMARREFPRRAARARRESLRPRPLVSPTCAAKVRAHRQPRERRSTRGEARPPCRPAPLPPQRRDRGTAALCRASTGSERESGCPACGSSARAAPGAAPRPMSIPKTGRRDMQIPRALEVALRARRFRHLSCCRNEGHARRRRCLRGACRNRGRRARAM